MSKITLSSHTVLCLLSVSSSLALGCNPGLSAGMMLQSGIVCKSRLTASDDHIALAILSRSDKSALQLLTQTSCLQPVGRSDSTLGWTY